MLHLKDMFHILASDAKYEQLCFIPVCFCY